MNKVFPKFQPLPLPRPTPSSFLIICVLFFCNYHYCICVCIQPTVLLVLEVRADNLGGCFSGKLTPSLSSCELPVTLQVGDGTCEPSLIYVVLLTDVLLQFLVSSTEVVGSLSLSRRYYLTAVLLVPCLL